LVCLPCLRVRGNYLALVTLGFGEICNLVMQNWSDFTGGPLGMVGIPCPVIMGVELVDNIHFYYLIAVIFLVVYVGSKRIVNSFIGRACIAIREDETAAALSGIKVRYYKLLMFTIGTFIAGVAGSYWASYLTVVAPLNFTLDESILMVMMLIVGGIGNLPGSVAGATIMILVSELFKPLYAYRFLMMGIILIFVLLWRPQGIVGKWGSAK